jgi:hypothetical protein
MSWAVFREEVRDKVGKPAPNLVPVHEPTFADVRETFPTGPDLARGLGLGENKDNPRGSPAWRKRRNLLDDYSRWRRGGRNPFRPGPRSRARELQRAVRAQWRIDATPSTELEVLQMMDLHGATVSYFHGRFKYEEERDRIVAATVFIAPEVFDHVGYSRLVGAGTPIDWPATAAAFLEGWAVAYGLDDNLRDTFGPDSDDDEEDEGLELEELPFDIGEGEGHNYDYRE